MYDPRPFLNVFRYLVSVVQYCSQIVRASLQVHKQAPVDENLRSCHVLGEVTRKEHYGSRDIVRRYNDRVSKLPRVAREQRERARDIPPSRPNAVLLIMPSRFAVSARSSLLISVAIVPGRTAFARMLYLPSATAQLCIRDRMPAFVGV